MLPRVIIAEQTSRFDLSSATRYGEIVCLSDVVLNPFTVEGVVGIFTHRLNELNFNPERDYVCLTGAQLIVPLMVGVVAGLHPTFRVLMFHAQTSDYRVRVFQKTKG